jgi:tRNA (guanine26-N2/guanine27-N2)-dimethyltransferase
MTGSGVRAVRYALEFPNVREVLAADIDPEAVRAAQRTIELNSLEGKVRATESEANVSLTEHLQDRFDLIDLDPFGSPAPFFESALRATLDGGILAATATDMGPLTGDRPAACFRKYAARPVRTEFEKEVAVRILAGCLARTACLVGLGIGIAFAHASDHYARIYASVSKGKTSANQTARQLGFLEYCPKCLMRETSNSLESIQMVCTNCESKVRIGGPIWLGPLWDGPTVMKMIQHTPTLASSRLSEIQTILSRILEEIDSPAFYYRTDAFAGALRIKPPGLAELIEALHAAGYRATRTHFAPNGFRTDARIEELTSLLGNWA